MSVYAGPADWWTDGTDDGRTHIATKGIVQSGLLLNLDAGVSSSYPGSGTKWTDLSGTGRPGNIVNGTYTSDKGGGIVFGATTEVGLLSGSALDFANGGYTISVWIKHTGVVSTARIQRYFTVGSSPVEGPVLRHNGSSNDNLQAYIFDSGSTLRQIVVNGQVFTNTYYNFVYTYDGTTFNLYNNASLVGTQTLTITLPTASGYKLGFNGTEYFEGNMYAAQYYNRGLSVAEIQQNYNALRGRFGI